LFSSIYTALTLLGFRQEVEQIRASAFINVFKRVFLFLPCFYFLTFLFFSETFFYIYA